MFIYWFSTISNPTDEHVALGLRKPFSKKKLIEERLNRPGLSGLFYYLALLIVQAKKTTMSRLIRFKQFEPDEDEYL